MSTLLELTLDVTQVNKGHSKSDASVSLFDTCFLLASSTARWTYSFQ